MRKTFFQTMRVGGRLTSCGTRGSTPGKASAPVIGETGSTSTFLGGIVYVARDPCPNSAKQPLSFSLRIPPQNHTKNIASLKRNRGQCFHTVKNKLSDCVQVSSGVFKQFDSQKACQGIITNLRLCVVRCVWCCRGMKKTRGDHSMNRLLLSV